MVHRLLEGEMMMTRNSSAEKTLRDIRRATRKRYSSEEKIRIVLESWMGSTHFLTRGLPSVSTEMSLHVMAYNLKRMMNIFGVKPLIEAIQA